MTSQRGRWATFSLLGLALWLLAAGTPTWTTEAMEASSVTDAAFAHPRELQQRLDAALAAKGADYKPRTEHLRSDGRPQFTNRLILEDSPYLLQHAHNPVDWYPWGPEAFEQARRENKLVFLSIGYSTCHWCHVMERESFEDLTIARLLNAHFIAIKVDREVHPDVDQTYMTAVELLAGRGGWPMSSILTPDGDTIDGGTYFPPTEFTQLLERARDLWQRRPEALRARAEQVARTVSRALDTQGQAAALDDAIIDQAVAELLARHDELQGGFGFAPKFPQEPKLGLLLDQALRTGDEASLGATILTLQSMARGGIHDQVGGGFHRYAIDNDWLVPHFEKMLYNQAQLAQVYLSGWRLTADPQLAQVARRTLDFVLRDLTSPEGGFYSATDADSDGSEGRFFLWTPSEIRAALPAEDADLAIRFHGVTETGNFEGANILHVPVALDAFAAAEDVSPDQLRQRLARIHETLYQVREGRPHPHRDDKILTGWNGMMIGALANAGDALDEPRYLAAAERAAELLWTKARVAPGELKRVYLDGRATQPGLLEDYAFLGGAMIALYDASADPRWLSRARELADALWSRFADPDGGGLFMGEASTETPLMARPKDLSDGPMPSGTSAALHLLAALDQRTDDLSDGNRARELLGAVSGRVKQSPSAVPSLLVALNRLRHGDTGPTQYAARGAIRLQGQVTRDGDSATLRLAIDMAPGWHINAHEPLQQALIATRLDLPESVQYWRIEDAGLSGSRYP
ncbi:thioredoxin domain-containing protein [Halochromatium salexigens]|nr:thioredoxin domain-containing protein [Halochromatium salexigens]